MTDASRLVTGAKREADAAEASLRPQYLAEFIGQEQARSNLKVFIEAAKARAEALDHVLFAGPPGLGKTTLAQIMARELGVGFRSTSGPVIAKAGDLAALLTNREDRDVLFIDEIHRLAPAVEEILYPAMEDFQLDLIIGSGPAARSVKIDLARFTLVGATTRAGLLTNPLRDRFGIPIRLNFYSESELEEIVNRGARVLGIGMTPDGANEIARRARGTPRIAGRLLRRVRDFALVAGATSIDRGAADRALTELEVDVAGLDAMDRRYLSTVGINYGGGPVGIETIAAALSGPRDALAEDIGAARDGERGGGRHFMPVRVYYEDTDFSGIVYHANYLRFMERGRTNYLRLIGAGHRALFDAAEREAPGFAFVVRAMTIEFLKPARMDDVLAVTTEPEVIKGASM